MFFFSISSLVYFGLNINLGYVSKEVLVVYDYLFTSQREYHSVPDIYFFAIFLLILSHLALLRIELPRLTSSKLIELVAIPVDVVDQFCFYVHQATNLWLFEKKKMFF